MKKLFFLLIAMLIANVCSATSIVRVSDYGSDGFYYRYNQIAKSIGSENLMITDMPKKDLTNDNFDTYICGFGQEGHKTTISLFVNKEGYVSKLMVMRMARDNTAMNNMSEAIIIILTALGVNRSELSYFVDELRKDNLSTTHWCNAANRYIMVENRSENDVVAVRFTAAVD